MALCVNAPAAWRHRSWSRHARPAAQTTTFADQNDGVRALKRMLRRLGYGTPDRIFSIELCLTGNRPVHASFRARLPSARSQTQGVMLRRSVNWAAGENTRVRMRTVATTAVMPDAARIIATMTNW